MAEPIPPYLEYRVLDPVSGAVVVGPLPHLHQSKWTIRGMQPGAPGSVSLGQGTIPLHPPNSEGGMAAAADYAALVYGQRIEGYLGAYQAGNPKVSGYITGLPIAENDYTIEATDSLWLAQRARTDRTLAFNGTTDTLLKNSLKAYGLIYGDDACNTFTGYTNNGTWGATTEEGLNVFQAGAGGDGLLYTTSSYTNAQYADCVIDAMYHVSTPATPGNTAEGGIIAAVTDANNLVMGRVLMQCITATAFTISAEIWTKVAGVYTQRSSIPILKGLTSNHLRCQVRLFGVQSGANYTWRVTVNGFDVGCTYTYAATPSGAVGLRSLKTGSAVGEVAYATNLYFANKQSIFAQGTITAGTKTLNQTFSRVPLLDLWNIAATAEGFQWRKNPKAGLYADTVDFGVLGTDLTASVKFVEGDNLIDAQVSPNVEPLATEVELLAAPGVDNQGTITWHNITAMKKYGVIADSYQSQDVADFLGQRSLVQAVAAKRAAPGAAKTLKVLRDSSTADKWRELDSVEVTAPRLGLNHQSVLVLAYTLEEGSAEQEITCDQFPLGTLEHSFGRLIRSVDALSNATAGATAPVLGARSIMSLLASVDVNTPTTVSSAAYVAVPGSTTSSFWLGSTSNVLIYADLQANVTGTNLYAYSQIFIDGAVTATTGIASTICIFNKLTVGYTNGSMMFLKPSMAAGTHTVAIAASTDAATTLNVNSGTLYVFQLGN